MKSLPAVILAAGKGTRLGSLSDHQPKPMTEVNGVAIIHNLMESLVRNGFERIVLVTGYLNDILEEAVRSYESQCEIIPVYNEIYATTNNIYSLWLAKEYLAEGFYLFEADVFFEDAVMSRLMTAPEENIILVGKHHPKMDGTVVDLDDSGKVSNMYLKRHQKDDFDFTDKYKTVNFYRIGKSFAQDFFLKRMDEHIDADDLNSYYELIIQEALEKSYSFYGLTTKAYKWWEIDAQEDLKYCETMFRQ